MPRTTEINIDPANNRLIREGVEGIINPLDSYAIEEAVRLKERFGGKVTAITMGPPQAEQALRETVSLGVDEAILLSDAAFAGSDTLATSLVLAVALKKIASYDIVVCGKQTLDGDTGQVGPELAQRLNIPFVAYVRKIDDIKDGSVRAERMIEDGYELVESPLPCVISVIKEINVPRLPSLRGMMKAKSIKIPRWTAQEMGIEPDIVGISGSATRVIRVFHPQRGGKGEIIQGNAENQVEQLIQKLQQKQLI